MKQNTLYTPSPLKGHCRRAYVSCKTKTKVEINTYLQVISHPI